ncbi:acyl-CoA synthetase (AMP-forming)/AMP-acid ligase II [Rheinheimera pacifica]|uniref:AMP-binding protein n=1 Tax=Rheinheimera pacifica TaxID=173990 RepID=UPI00285EC702|nr:AMP-binding protein [Rheinheimera pacifica]MDR6983930.1 acyl-CoA synthetase (AMP-forming)/AMP-acid ligase II [Rheinheimera pacifica]
MNLLQRLQQANYHSTAISADTDISYPQLISQAQQLRQQYPALQNQAIALSYNDLNAFTCALLAFDGWCSALYLLPDNNLELPEQVIRWPENTVSETAAPVTTATLWHLATSGTTGTPKWIAHSFTSLSRAAKTSVQSAALRWALCYQPTRFAGLQVLLQSLLSGAVITDCSSGDAQQRISLMQLLAITAISATPSLWRQLLMTGQLSTLPLQQITLGGEIADQSLLDTLAALFPASRLLHIYASTEAGVGFAVADKRAGFPASWLNQYHSNLFLKVDANQHLWLKPPQPTAPLLASAVDSDGYLDSGDLVTIVQDRVVFLGRASGVINVGGNKVHPEQVEQVLLQHPVVRQAKVYAKASSVLGQLVIADIVIDTGIDSKTVQMQLLLHCQQQLERYQLPTRLNIVSSIATNATGKLSRKTNTKEPHE